MKLEFSRHIFEKHSNVKFHENSSIGSRVFPCGQMERRTDRYDEANSSFLEFCGSAYKHTRSLQRVWSSVHFLVAGVVQTVVFGVQLPRSANILIRIEGTSE